MPLNGAVTQRLRRVFTDGFSVRDIAEPLAAFDSTASAATVRAAMEASGYVAAGVRENGIVVGYLEQAELGNGSCIDFVKPFEDACVVLDTTGFAEAILALTSTPRLFVSVLGDVGGIVTRTDLQKPPVRMWLFGMVTLIEIRFTQMIERNWSADTWKQFLSEGRVRKAEELHAERTRRNQQIRLLDCLQLSDKGQIIARHEALRKTTLFESRRQMDQAVKDLERLRNNLAHSQDIVNSDWEMILALSQNLDQVLEGPTMPERADDAGR